MPTRNLRKVLVAAAVVGSVGLSALACNNLVGMADEPPPPEDMAMPFMGPYPDLPADPQGAGGIMAGQVGAIASAFKSATANASGGPCILEPTLGALYPKNFTPPLFEWTAPMGHNIFELRFHVDNQINDLVIYTDSKSFTLPESLWVLLGQHSSDRDIQVTVRSGQLTAGQLSGGAFAGSAGTIKIAPVDAPGTIVYWTTSGGSALRGFRVGDKTLQTVLTPQSITNAGKATTCVGCHASSPDGLLTFFSRADPRFSIDVRRVDGSSGAPPTSQVTANALANLSRTNQLLPTLNKLHYTATDSVVVTVMNGAGTNGKYELIWTDLLATTGGTGIIARNGDTNNAGTPAWDHSGNFIAYTSGGNMPDGRPDTGTYDIWTVPYNNHAGGQATKLTGASDAAFNEYYPVYSPDDTFLAFNRVPAGAQTYDAAAAEVFLVPGRGGQSVRIAANDPPACSSQKSPGLTNSWPRWAPQSTRYLDRRYYWLVFSSKRRPGGSPQLFISAVVTIVSGSGEAIEKTYPAVYIPTQPGTENNHTPAWDEFQIPVIG